MRPLFAFVLGLAACGAPPSLPPSVSSPDAALIADAVGADTIDPLDAAPDAPGGDVASQDAPPDASSLAYPAGPYGSAVGQTVADLAWEGYVNEAHELISTELPYGPTTMGAVRATGAPFALVHLSGFL